MWNERKKNDREIQRWIDREKGKTHDSIKTGLWLYRQTDKQTK